MRISFDLDDTLICYADSVPQERNRVPWLLRRWLNEPLRLGATKLVRELQQRGCEVWIYTTSPRSRWAIQWWLRCYGIRVAAVINQQAYANFQRHHPMKTPPSKLPKAFGIDLHVDDSEGVQLEGERHGSKVLVVSPHNDHWVHDVLAAVDALLASPKHNSPDAR